MKLRTVDDILDRLDREIGWRRKEIDRMKTVVRRESNGFSNTLIRAGIPLIYAHWEGFVKAGVEAVLCFVSLRDKTYEELAPCFAVHGVKGKIDELTKPKKVQIRIEAMKFLMSEMKSKADFSWRGQIDTGSNLTFDRFSDIAAAIGINVSRYETRKNFVDKSLVKRRNLIAHGAKVDLDINGFMDVADQVQDLLQRFKTDLEDCISNKSYLRP